MQNIYRKYFVSFEANFRPLFKHRPIIKFQREDMHDKLSITSPHVKSYLPIHLWWALVDYCPTYVVPKLNRHKFLFRFHVHRSISDVSRLKIIRLQQNRFYLMAPVTAFFSLQRRLIFKAWYSRIVANIFLGNMPTIFTLLSRWRAKCIDCSQEVILMKAASSENVGRFYSTVILLFKVVSLPVVMLVGK